MGGKVSTEQAGNGKKIKNKKSSPIQHRGGKYIRNSRDFAGLEMNWRRIISPPLNFTKLQESNTATFACNSYLLRCKKNKAIIKLHVLVRFSLGFFWWRNRMRSFVHFSVSPAEPALPQFSPAAATHQDPFHTFPFSTGVTPSHRSRREGKVIGAFCEECPLLAG